MFLSCRKGDDIKVDVAEVDTTRLIGDVGGRECDIWKVRVSVNVSVVIIIGKLTFFGLLVGATTTDNATNLA